MVTIASFITSAQVRVALAVLVYGVALISSLGIAYFYNEDMNKGKWQADAWMNPVITQEEEKSMEWVRANTPERETFVTDIFGGEHLMGESLREGTEGGDWAIIPNVVARMGDVNEFYKTSDSQKAYEIARRYNANYVMIPNREVFAGFEWLFPPWTTREGVPLYDTQKLKNEQFFELAYKDGNFEYYKLK